MRAYFAGGRYDGLMVDTEQIFGTEMWNGRWSPSHSDERAKGLCVPRVELDNQPKVDGYLGPMWDGDKLRYETKEVYDALSY